jgi:hypothetical protein
VRTARVLADDADGLLLWVAGGSPAVVTKLADGQDLRGRRAGQATDGAAASGHTTWQGNGVLMLGPPGRAWSLWWFFADDG